MRKSWYSEVRRYNQAYLDTAVHIYNLMPIYTGMHMTRFQEKPEPDTSWCAQCRKKCMQKNAFEGLCQGIRLKLDVPPQSQ